MAGSTSRSGDLQGILAMLDLHSLKTLAGLRGAQFAARLNFQLAPETLELCQTLDLNELSRERLLRVVKLLLRAERPSIGLEILRQTKALRFFPEQSD